MAERTLVTAFPELHFKIEWLGSDGVRAPELAATWARLEVWVGADCVTQVEDRETSSARTAIYCSLYPLAEWIAYNWWFLNAHSRVPLPFVKPRAELNGGPRDWWQFHNMRASGDGFLWPNLTLIPEGQFASAYWEADPTLPDSWPIRYLGQGRALLGSADTSAALGRFVDTVLDRLDELQVRSTRLHEEWDAVRAADSDEAEFSIAAARLGIDPYDIDENTAAALTQAGEAFEPPLLMEFLDSVESRSLGVGVEWIERGTKRLQSLTTGASSRVPHVRTLPTDNASDLPWEAGYRQARAVRTQLRASEERPLDLGSVFVIRQMEAPDPGLVALGGLSTSGAAGLVVGRRLYVQTQRFVEARALWHLVSEKPRTRFLVTTSHSGRQRIERAFAAELLAPARGIASLLESELTRVDDSDVDRLARHYRVSPLVIEHQIQNQLSRATEFI